MNNIRKNVLTKRQASEWGKEERREREGERNKPYSHGKRAGRQAG